MRSDQASYAEESPVITTIVNEALDDGNLIRFGLALHPYLDTFSHQGFSGILSKVNDIKKCRALSDIPGGLLNRLIKIFMDGFRVPEYQA